MTTTTNAASASSRGNTVTCAMNHSTDISVESSHLSSSDELVDNIEIDSSTQLEGTDDNERIKGDDDVEMDRTMDSSMSVATSQYLRKASAKKFGNVGSTPKRVRNYRWTTVIVGMSILIGFAAGIYFYLESRGVSLKKQSRSSAASKSTFSLSELKSRNDPTTDCWLSIHDTVYDLTAYSLEHPGGPEFIWDFCGTNATRGFDLQHPIAYLNRLSSGTIMGTLQIATAESNANNSTRSQGNATEQESEPAAAPIANENEPSNEDLNNVTSATAAPSLGGVATSEPTTAAVCISESEVALHASRDDCWYILYGQVYDFTEYIDLHPGGVRFVFQECGTDATSVFITVKKHDQDLLVKVGAPDLYLLADAC
jgi:cytochrome b involved in lipid metabolism